MMLYEMRTYTAHVGKLGELKKLYQEIGFPVLCAGGFDKYLVGYFIADTGNLNQLVHIWRFEEDGDRPAFWARLLADKDFNEKFLPTFRTCVATMEMKLFRPAPWGPQP